jgi:hypothetical protein
MSHWNIKGLEEGESVLSVAPVLEGNDFTRRVVVTDRRVLTIRSPFFASTLGLARFTRSKIELSIPLREVKSATFVGGFTSSLTVVTAGTSKTYSASGIGSRWLRHVNEALGNLTN